MFCIGGLAFFGVSASNKGIKYVDLDNDLATYRAHHEAKQGWYYQTKSISSSGKKTFIIAMNVRPGVEMVKSGETQVALTENGSLVEIEVPAKYVGPKTGPYFTVKVVDGIQTTIYFPNKIEMVRHALNT